ncbi:hypothetical protein WG899_12270 [Paucibacter sp. AS339]|uniref:hypothetical protein n=1 Tax=Paucibacter hankyongi TaxID=3133434 RepID=UPI0030A36D65
MPSIASMSSLAWLRTLVWIIALALPLQAQARMAMLGCGAASNLVSSSAHGLGALPHAEHDHQAMLAQQDGHALGRGHHQVHQTQDKAQAETPSLDETATHHACSACATCCLGMALPCATLNLVPSFGAAVFSASPEPASLAVVTATLERPPRALLQR